MTRNVDQSSADSSQVLNERGVTGGEDAEIDLRGTATAGPMAGAAQIKID